MEIEEWGLTKKECKYLNDSYPKGVSVFPHVALKCCSCSGINFPGNKDVLHANVGGKLLSQERTFVSPKLYREVFSHFRRCCIGSALQTCPIILRESFVRSLQSCYTESAKRIFRKHTEEEEEKEEEKEEDDDAEENEEGVVHRMVSMDTAEEEKKRKKGKKKKKKKQKRKKKMKLSKSKRMRDFPTGQTTLFEGPTKQKNDRSDARSHDYDSSSSSSNNNNAEESSSSSSSQYMYHPHGLFPRPQDPCDIGPLLFSLNNRRQISHGAGGVASIGSCSGGDCSTSGPSFRSPLSLFKNAGRLLGQAIIEGRTLDIDISPALLEHLGAGRTQEDHLHYIDPVLHKSLSKLFRLARAVKHYKAITSTMGLRVGEGKGGGRRRQRRGPSAAAATSAANLEKLFTIDGCTVEDLCLTFVAPSMGSKQGPVELVPRGIDVAVTVQNLESYLQKVYRYILSSSVRVQIDAMKAGFQEVCSTEAFSVLDLRERSQLISGEDGKGIRSWDFSTESLRNNIVCAQGYTLGSPSIQNLIEILGEMNPATRRSQCRILDLHFFLPCSAYFMSSCSPICIFGLLLLPISPNLTTYIPCLCSLSPSPRYLLRHHRGFIQYLTGCPRLPAGQLAALRPKITVVRVAWFVVEVEEVGR